MNGKNRLKCLLVQDFKQIWYHLTDMSEFFGWLGSRKKNSEMPVMEKTGTFVSFDEEKLSLRTHVADSIANIGGPKNLADQIIKSIDYVQSIYKSTFAWFNTTYMQRERVTAVKKKRKAESITQEAGIWVKDYLFVENTSQLEDAAEVEKKIRTAFDEIKITHDKEVKKIFDDNVSRFTFAFDHRLDRKKKVNNIDPWMVFINSHRVKSSDGQETSIKEWGVELRDDGKYYARTDQSQPLIEIQTVNQTEWNRRMTESNLEINPYKDISEKNLVGKVVLIKDEHGKIIRMKTFYGHVYADEKQGRWADNQIFAKLGITDDDLRLPEEGVEVNRRIEGGLDIKGVYELTLDEITSYKGAKNSFLEGADLNFPEIQMSGALALNKEFESGYICNDPKVKPAGLQIEMIPKLPFVDKLASLVDLPNNQIANVDQINTLLSDNVNVFELDLRNLAKYCTVERKNCSDGIGLSAILDTYVGYINKKKFEWFVSPAYKRFNSGQVQQSDADLKEESVSRGLFSTALGEQINLAPANTKMKGHSYVSLRKRVMSNEPESKILRSHIDEMTRLRLLTVSIAHAINAHNILSYLPASDRSGNIQKLNAQTQKTIDAIMNSHRTMIVEFDRSKTAN